MSTHHIGLHEELRKISLFFSCLIWSYELSFYIHFHVLHFLNWHLFIFYSLTAFLDQPGSHKIQAPLQGATHHHRLVSHHSQVRYAALPKNWLDMILIVLILAVLQKYLSRENNLATVFVEMLQSNRFYIIIKF